MLRGRPAFFEPEVFVFPGRRFCRDGVAASAEPAYHVHRDTFLDEYFVPEPPTYLSSPVWKQESAHRRYLPALRKSQRYRRYRKQLPDVLAIFFAVITCDDDAVNSSLIRKASAVGSPLRRRRRCSRRESAQDATARNAELSGGKRFWLPYCTQSSRTSNDATRWGGVFVIAVPEVASAFLALKTKHKKEARIAITRADHFLHGETSGARTVDLGRFRKAVAVLSPFRRRRRCFLRLMPRAPWKQSCSTSPFPNDESLLDLAAAEKTLG
ncbi:hypothetical protein MRX96_013842 [Rhipicephalus microplus]